jgi:hypothetical protein
MPPRKEHTFNGVENQAVVHIDVADDTINCFPQRAGDTIIFNCHDPGKPPKAHPCEVRWMVTGLTSGRFVRIQPKPGASTGVFKGLSQLDIHHGFNSATSGAPDQRAGEGLSLNWPYDILLCEGPDDAPRVLARLDPGIIIKDYP